MTDFEEYIEFVLSNVYRATPFELGVTLAKHSDFSENKDILRFHEIRKLIIEENDLNLKYFRQTGVLPNIFVLTDTGRIAKQSGGHLKYQELLNIENSKSKYREDKSDQITDLDLLTKRFIYTARYWPYIVSFGALTVSIFAYFKPEKKQIDLQPMQQEIQKLKSQTNKLYSLFQTDIHLKKTISKTDTSVSSGHNNE